MAGKCPEVLRKELGAVAINMAADGPTSCQHYLFLGATSKAGNCLQKLGETFYPGDWASNKTMHIYIVI